MTMLGQDDAGATPERRAGTRRRRLIVFIPLVVFLALAALFMYRLGAGDPSRIPSALIGRPAPSTNLPPIPGLERDGRPVPGLDGAAFNGEVTVLNVWASWCVACRDEHPVLTALARSGIAPVYGLNYKDKRDEAIEWLRRFGDPYQASLFDADGRVGIDYGVYGVPETYVIDKQGVIRYKRIGPVTPDIVKQKIAPLIVEINRG